MRKGFNNMDERFDDFIIGPQIDEIIPEEYDDWMSWVYSNHEED